MGRGDTDDRVPDEAKAFKAPDDSRARRGDSEELKRAYESAAFQRFTEVLAELHGNVDSVGKYAQEAEADGVSSELVNNKILVEIEAARKNIQRTKDEIATMRASGDKPDSFDAGAEGTVHGRQSMLDTRQERLHQLTVLARKRGMNVN